MRSPGLVDILTCRFNRLGMQMQMVTSEKTAALAELLDYQILDTVPEAAFDDLVRLASLICGTPIALITLLDEGRQWFKARVGLDLPSTPSEYSFCRYTILHNELLVVPDTTEDDRFANNPFVTGEPNIRFYAGAPLITPGNHRIGALCVLDRQARNLNTAQREALAALSRQAMTQLELRRNVRRLTLAIEQRDAALVSTVHTHQELVKRNAHHELIMATVSEGIVTQTLEGGIQTCNTSACQILGLTPEQLAGRNPSDPRWSTVREDGSEFPGDEHPVSLTLRTGLPCSGVVMGIRRPNSEIRWISINTRLLGKTDPSDRDTVVASFHDITGFKRSEAELAEATRFAESIAEQTTCIIYILDLEKEILTYANRSVGEFLGYGLETIAKMGDDFLPTINHPDDLAMVHERLTAFKDVADGQVVEYTTRCKHANGDWRSLWHRQVVFRRNPDGRPCQVMGTTQDITDLLKIQEELASARDAANLANRAKSQFLANMSHEIRTPMTAILGFADRLQEPDLTDADRTDCVQTIRRNGAHLMKVIDDILDLSKIEAGKMTVERIPVNPKKKVQDVVSLLEPRARERGLRLTVSFQSGIPGLILSDPTRILQILTNLVGNAIKFTARGQVRVEVSMSGPVGARRLLRFAVIDTGAGMTPDQLSRLFRPFSQADASTTRKYGGTGLGLAICRGLAERLGGTLHAQSMLGKGSAFTLTLDPGVTVKAQIRSARDAGVSPRSALPRLDARILLVEDGEDNQRLISHFLRSAGAKVTLAGNGKIACDLANNSSGNPPPFDLILMDMQMPGMDGYTATQTLRSSGWTGPILALTAHSLEEERRSCLTAGCSGFLAKPITRERLIRSAHEAVSDPRLSNPFLNNSAPRQPAVLDRAIAKLLSEYTSELPRLADEIEQFTKANDLAALGVAAHRLRGSGGSYGFPAISAAATNVEEAALSNGPADMLHAAVEELVQAMRRASQP